MAFPFAARLVAAVGLAVALPACGTFPFGDGIPHDGVNTTLTIQQDGHVQQVIAWGEGGSGYRFEWNGLEHPRITADDRDFLALGNGSLTLTGYDGGSVVARLEIQADGLSEARHFTRDGGQVPYEPEGAAWLAVAIPRLIDHAGLGATSRVPRILAQGGMDAVLADISRRETNLARNEYYEVVVEDADMSSADIARAIHHAGQEMDSDAQLADVLEEAVEARPGDPLILDAVLDAAAAISSDAHLADLLETAVEEGRATGPQLETLLDLAGASIGSDAQLADVLDSVATRQDLSLVTSPAFVRALGAVDSDAHAADILEDLVAHPGLGAQALADVLSQVAPGISSDAHLADVLEGVRPDLLVDDAARRGFLVALDSVDSDAHAADVLEELVEQCDDPRVLADLVRAAGGGISSDAHLADVLQGVAPGALEHPPLRAALRAALDTIGSSAQRDAVQRCFPDGALND